MVIKIGVNGFGRIGRIIFRTCFPNPNIQVSAINDPVVDIEYICYLIKFDSTHGKFNNAIDYSEDQILIDGNKIKVFREQLPSAIPWHTLDVQYVVEASGMFATLEKASGHLSSDSVKRVIVTAPSIDIPMIVLGVNDDQIKRAHKVISCASSTLYCLAPIIKILENNYGISEGFVTSIHAMTPSLKPLDGLCLRGRHWRDHRSIHQNIIPAATGACKALGKIIPQVKDKMCGMAFRVPIVNVSVLDITVRLNNSSSLQEITKKIKEERGARMKNIIDTSCEEAVSSDFLNNENSCILDVNSSLQLTPHSFKLVCWYENEYSYACRVIDTIMFSEEQLKPQVTPRTFLKHIIPKTPHYCESITAANKGTTDILCNFKFKHNLNIFNTLSEHVGFKRKFNKQIFKDSLQRFEFKRMNSISMKSKNTAIECNSPEQHLHQNINELVKVESNTEDLFKKSQSELNTDNLKEVNIVENQEINEKRNNTQSLNENTEHYATTSDEISVREHNISNTLQIESFDKSNIIFVREGKNDLIQDNCMKATSVDTNITEIVANSRPENELTCKETTQDLCFNVPSIQSIGSLSDDVNMNLPINNQLLHDNTTAFDTFSHYGNHSDGQICLNERYDKGQIIINEEINSVKGNDQNESPHNSIWNTIESDTLNTTSINNMEDCTSEASESNKAIKKRKLFETLIKKLTKDRNDLTPEESSNLSIATVAKLSRQCSKIVKPDLYDKLASSSDSDSDNSIQIFKKKSQVIDLNDFTHSLEDLSRLDKICKIIEISDELSDQLFSVLNSENEGASTKKWSFKDLCERIKLDDFCHKVFGQ